MKSHRFSSAPFRYDGNRHFAHAKTPTAVEPFYTDETDRAAQLDALAERMDQAQNMMHADEHYGLVVLFQAMDAAGKDSSIRHVFKGLNPSRFKISSFTKPSDTDQAHDFLWRFWKELPERGFIGVFNRSYYEEVLALKVHPNRLQEQSIPQALISNLDQLWQERYTDIRNVEDYWYRNGFRVVKFYLHVAKEEQGQRLIARLSDSEKQWKLSESDLKERETWTDYMRVYEDMVNETASQRNPWYVIPSDDRANQQLMVAHIMAEVLESLPVSFPERDEAGAKKFIRIVKKQDRA